MERVCNIGKIRGRIEAPASKSAMQRAIACALLAEGTSIIEFSGSPCADSRAAGKIAAALGAKLSWMENSLTITGSHQFAVQPWSLITEAKNLDDHIVLECGESGLCIRMFSPLASLLDKKIEMKAAGSLAVRPMTMMISPFAQLGVTCETDSGHPPVQLRGPMHGGKIIMDSGGSSQFLTGLLMALALTLEGGHVELKNPVSKGYLDLTAAMCGKFGVKVQIANDYREYSIPGGQKYQPASIKVEGDWSGAAFLAVGAAIASTEGLLIGGLDPDSSQPDKAVIDAMMMAGADVNFSNGRLAVRKHELLPFVFDATQCPDLFPPLVVLAAASNGVSTIRGIGRLKGKESDRALSLQQCFRALGIRIELIEDEMRIWGGSISGGSVDACDDHRIAMAAATASLVASGPVIIEGSECVGKSWPRFYEDLEGIKS